MPGNIAAHEEQERRYTARRKSRQIAENHSEDNSSQQRLDQGPGWSENRLLVLRNEVPFDKQEN